MGSSQTDVKNGVERSSQFHASLFILPDAMRPIAIRTHIIPSRMRYACTLHDSTDDWAAYKAITSSVHDWLRIGSVFQWEFAVFAEMSRSNQNQRESNGDANENQGEKYRKKREANNEVLHGRRT